MGCCSARRLDADRRSNVLILFDVRGSNEDADQQAKNVLASPGASIHARGVRSNAHSYRNWGEGLGKYADIQNMRR